MDRLKRGIGDREDANNTPLLLDLCLRLFLCTVFPSSFALLKATTVLLRRGLPFSLVSDSIARLLRVTCALSVRITACVRGIAPLVSEVSFFRNKSSSIFSHGGCQNTSKAVVRASPAITGNPAPCWGLSSLCLFINLPLPVQPAYKSLHRKTLLCLNPEKRQRIAFCRNMVPRCHGQRLYCIEIADGVTVERGTKVWRGNREKKRKHTNDNEQTSKTRPYGLYR